MFKGQKIIFAMIMLFLLANCGGGGSGGDFMASIKSAMNMEPTKVWLQRIYFEVDEKLNNDAPVTMDVLIVYEQSLLEAIAKLNASQYFGKREQIQRDGGNALQTYTFELVPGQTLPPQPIKLAHVTGKGIIVFARYATPGDHRQAIGVDREVTIEMGRQDFKIVPVKHPNDD
jgi:type VI secretion system protein